MNSYIVFLQGVTINDVREFKKSLDNKFNVDPNQKTNVVVDKKYDRHPLIFKDFAKEWEPVTNVRCSGCTLRFTNKPVPILTKFEEDNNKVITYECLDNVCCNVTCAAYYIKHYLDDRMEYKYMLRKMFQIYYGTPVKFDIPESLPFINLNSYGGTMSVTEYKAANKKILSDHLRLEENV
jgi:hypothetical protein